MKVIDKPDAERLTSLMGGLDHAIGVFDRIAHRLFAQDMTAHLEGAYRLPRSDLARPIVARITHLHRDIRPLLQNARVAAPHQTTSHDKNTHYGHQTPSLCHLHCPNQTSSRTLSVACGFRQPSLE